MVNSQDDSMLSTPSSHAADDTFDTMDDDSNFQTQSSSSHAQQLPHNNPTTTTGVDPGAHLNAAVPGELSPPRSANNTPALDRPTTQTNGTSRTADDMIEPDDLDSDEDEGVDMTEAGDMTQEPTLAESSAARRRPRTSAAERDSGPGSGWRNKKAQEEMQRAWENVVDRDFDVRVYPDPLAHKLR